MENQIINVFKLAAREAMEREGRKGRVVLGRGDHGYLVTTHGGHGPSGTYARVERRVVRKLKDRGIDIRGNGNYNPFPVATVEVG